MALNNFLPFAPTDTGTNLLSQSDYAAATDRDIGNQPGVASSKLVNKAIRQSAYISSQVAQFVADTTNTDVVDDATPSKLLAQIKLSMQQIPPIFTKYLSGTGTHNPTYYFYIASGNATAGATYTNNSITFTVVSTVSSATVVKMTGGGAPLSTGTLTKTSGSGDATLSFYGARSPVFSRIRLVGGGGGGGAATGTTPGLTGGSTTFGTSLLTATGGTGGVNFSGTPGTDGGDGGSATVLSPGVAIVALKGGRGGDASDTAFNNPGFGSAGPWGGGAGTSGASGVNPNGSDGLSGPANSGSGGSGAALGSGGSSGGGGGAGGYIEAIIPAPLTTYPYVVGIGGTGGPGTKSGGTGGSGIILVEEYYQ